MTQTSEDRVQKSLLIRVTAALMSLVVSGIGALSFFSGYAPERSTRFGMAGPLFGDQAEHYGIALFIIGLMPLAFFARSNKQAGRYIAVVLVAFWIAAFGPLVF